MLANTYVASCTFQSYLKMLSAYVSNNFAASRKTSFEFSHNAVTAGDTAILFSLYKLKVLSRQGKTAKLMLTVQFWLVEPWVSSVADLSTPEYVSAAKNIVYNVR